MLMPQQLTAGRTGAVTQWGSEERLVDALESALRAEPTATGVRSQLWREFDTGYGYADLLAVHYDEGTVADRRRRASSPAGDFGPLEGHAMTLLLPERPVRLDDLRQRLRIGRGRVERLANTLTARGLVVSGGDTILASPLRQVWALRSVEAYEAKLAKWREAAEQACRHVWFASRACVVMPSLGPTVGRRAADLCREWRLGFWVFDGRPRPRVRTVAVPRTALGWVLNERVFEECCRAVGRADR